MSKRIKKALYFSPQVSYKNGEEIVLNVWIRSFSYNTPEPDATKLVCKELQTWCLNAGFMGWPKDVHKLLIYIHLR